MSAVRQTHGSFTKRIQLVISRKQHYFKWGIKKTDGCNIKRKKIDFKIEKHILEDSLMKIHNEYSLEIKFYKKNCAVTLKTKMSKLLLTTNKIFNSFDQMIMK